MPSRRVELTAEQAELIEQLCSDGRAKPAQRPHLVRVTGVLSHEEALLLKQARDAASQYLARQRPVSEQRARERDDRKRVEVERARRLRARQRFLRKEHKERSTWLRMHVKRYRSATAWQRAAWHAAYRAYRWLGVLTAVVAWTVAASVFVVDQNSRLGVLIAAAALGFGGLQLRRGLVVSHARFLIRRWQVAREEGRRVPPELRAAVFARDGRSCQYCGVTEDLHLDHRVPFSRGGRTTLQNLQVLCGPCNIRKGVRSDGEMRRELGVPEVTPADLPRRRI